MCRVQTKNRWTSIPLLMHTTSPPQSHNICNATVAIELRHYRPINKCVSAAKILTYSPRIKTAHTKSMSITPFYFCAFWLLRTLPCKLIHMDTMVQNCDVLQVILYLLTIKEGQNFAASTRPHLNYMNPNSQLTLQCPTLQKTWPMELCSCCEVLLCNIQFLCNIYIYIYMRERERERERERQTIYIYYMDQQWLRCSDGLYIKSRRKNRQRR